MRWASDGAVLGTATQRPHRLPSALVTPAGGRDGVGCHVVALRFSSGNEIVPESDVSPDNPGVLGTVRGAAIWTWS